MKNIKKIVVAFICLLLFTTSMAQDAAALLQKVKEKMFQVNDYVADGKMKTNVVFIKAPIGTVKIYYKKPNKLKVVQQKGISILPKGGVSINAASIIGMANCTAFFQGEAIISGTKTKIVKLIPNDENSDIVLTTVYIDEANLLVKKSTTTTKENGSFEMEMFYGKYANLGLPDKMIFSFNVKDYKMPKGITLEFDDDLKKEDKQKLKTKKGSVEFVYTNYVINKGVDDSVFK
jgi:hypothetical protein